MKSRSCRVTLRDMEGTEHSVDVTASSLYEAVALGLSAIRGHDWVQETIDIASVSVVEVPVEHEVRINDFYQWVEREGGAPRDIVARARVREILGLPATPRR